MATQLEYAQISANVYTRTLGNFIPVPENWSRLDWATDDPVTGFSRGAYSDGQELVIAFTGTTDENNYDWITNVGAGVGVGGPQLYLAVTYVLDMMQRFPGASISFTGHSLGGGIASVMAILFDRPAVVFDEAPFKASVTTTYDSRFAVDPTFLTGLRDYLLQTNHAGLSIELSRYLSPRGYMSYPEREGRVTATHVEGEVLQYLRMVIPAIGRIDSPIPVDQPEGVSLAPLSASKNKKRLSGRFSFFRRWRCMRGARNHG